MHLCTSSTKWNFNFCNLVGATYIKCLYYMTSFARGMFDTKMVLAALQMECWYTEYMPLNYLYKHIPVSILKNAQGVIHLIK